DLPGEPGEEVWFTEVHHTGAAVPSVSLHAWTGGAGAAGDLLTPGAEAGATHVGVVRWWLRSGLVETVRVEQGSRGRGLGRAQLAGREQRADAARLLGRLPPARVVPVPAVDLGLDGVRTLGPPRRAVAEVGLRGVLHGEPLRGQQLAGPLLAREGVAVGHRQG